MSVHLYLSLLPEALVGSMLPPREYGRHLALGPGKRIRSQAVFFEVDRDEAAKYIDLAQLDQRCVPHPDGSPRRSSYLSIYRVLEKLPVSALRKLWLTTRDGTSLGLERGDYQTKPGQKYRLYQEFCPVSPRVVAQLDPLEFCRSITSPGGPVHVPRIIFADFRLDGLANDPAAKSDLPYRNLGHIRFCLEELQRIENKVSKIVDRDLQSDPQLWMIENGFFVGDQNELAHFPLPPEDDLRRDHYDWWSSARAVEKM